MKVETTSYDEIQKEYRDAFGAYKKAHDAYRRNYCKSTRTALGEAVAVLNNTSFVKCRNI